MPKLKGIYVDDDSKIIYEETKNILSKSGFQENDYLIGLGQGMNGLAYAEGGICPGGILYSTSMWSDVYLENFKKSDYKDKKYLFFILNNPNFIYTKLFFERIANLGIVINEKMKIGSVKYLEGNFLEIYRYETDLKSGLK